MADEVGNIVPLKSKQQPSPEGWTQREQEALSLARLGAMTGLEYERARVSAAKQLGCRVSWLDQKIEIIRNEADAVKHWPPPADRRVEVGTPIPFWPERGESIMGFLVAAAHRAGRDAHVLVLADGNGTVLRTYPLSDEQLAEIRARRNEQKGGEQ
jgi:hypothetical protein